MAALYERLDLFGRPSAGLDIALDGIAATLKDAAERRARIDIDQLVEQVERARSQAISDLPRVIYSDAYNASQADEILAMVPEELERNTRKFVLGASNDLGLKIVDKGGEALYYLELGTSLTVEALPGVPEESRWLGTFDRAEAIAKDELDFFASGHPLVEGLLLELADGPRGRAAVLEIPHEARTDLGLLCVYKDGARWFPLAVDAAGRVDAELAGAVISSLAEARSAKPQDWGIADRFSEVVHALADTAQDAAPAGATLEATVFFRFIEAESADG